MFQMLMSSECAEFWVYASEEFEADQWGQNSKHWYNISGSSSVDAKTNDKIEFDEENRGISVASGYVVNEKILVKYFLSIYMNLSKKLNIFEFVNNIV